MMPPGGYVGGRPKDPSKLSDDARRTRIRARRAAKKYWRKPDDRLLAQMKQDMEILYKKPVEEWTLEELAHGRPAGKHGFTGRPPEWVTPIIVREAKRRLMSETFGMLAVHLEAAVHTIFKLMTSEEVDEKGRPIVDARTRLAAAQFIIENVLGKPKAIVELETTDITRQALASAIVLDDGMPQDMPIVIQGSVVEEEEDSDGNDS